MTTMAQTDEEKKKSAQATTAATTNPDADLDAMQQRAAEYREAADNVETPKPSVPEGFWQRQVDEARRTYGIEDAAQREARERRERRERQIAAIADGLVGIANIAGAMGGATPVRQSNITGAAKRGHDEAAAFRRANAQRFEAARQHYAGKEAEQRGKDAEAAAAANKERLALRRRADDIDADVAAQRTARERNRSNARLGGERNAIARQNAAANKARAAASQQRAATANRAATADDETWKEYAWWYSRHKEEADAILRANGQTHANMLGDDRARAISIPLAKQINAKMRQAHGSPYQNKADRPKKKGNGSNVIRYK